MITVEITSYVWTLTYGPHTLEVTRRNFKKMWVAKLYCWWKNICLPPPFSCPLIFFYDAAKIVADDGSDLV